jgi:hypothetical protein
MRCALCVVRGAGAAGHCPTLGPKVGFAGPPYKCAGGCWGDALEGNREDKSGPYDFCGVVTSDRRADKSGPSVL